MTSLARGHGADVTSYDWLKTFALLAMIADHIGFYFYPDSIDWRIVGRMSAPVWFFLVGYARTRKLDGWIQVGLLILIASRFAAGMPIFPVSILAGFLLIRAGLDGMMARAVTSRWAFPQANLCLAILAFPTSMLVEYGTAGVPFAMAGWLARRQEQGDKAGEERLALQILLAVLLYIAMETLTFSLRGIPLIALGIEMIVVSALLMLFRPRVFPAFNRTALLPLKLMLQFCGRWTLEIYVVHLLLFQTAASILDPTRFPALTFRVFGG
jgi:hypothetical protein